MVLKCISEHRPGPLIRDWGLRAKYNKIGYFPYISNPALAGFNMGVVESLPRGLCL